MSHVPTVLKSDRSVFNKMLPFDDNGLHNHLKSYSAVQVNFNWLHLRNEFNIRKVHGIINTSKASLTLQETRSIHDSMNLSKIEFIANIYF